MKLAILSRAPRCYSTQRLKLAALDRGHECKVLNTLRFAIDLSSSEPDLQFRGKPLSDYDAILPRVGRVDHVLRFGGRAPVRADGRVHPEHGQRHHELARQAAGHPDPVAPRHRHAEDLVRAQPPGRAPGDRSRRWRTGRGQAARGNPGHRGDPRPGSQGGRGDHRDAAQHEPERPDPGVHQGEQGARHPGAGGRRSSRRRDAANRAGRRVPLERPPGWIRGGCHARSGVRTHRRAGGADHGPASGRRRHAGGQRGAAGHGGQLVARPAGDRDRDRARRRRRDHRPRRQSGGLPGTRRAPAPHGEHRVRRCGVAGARRRRLRRQVDRRRRVARSRHHGADTAPRDRRHPEPPRLAGARGQRPVAVLRQPRVDARDDPGPPPAPRSCPQASGAPASRRRLRSAGAAHATALRCERGRQRRSGSDRGRPGRGGVGRQAHAGD